MLFPTAVAPTRGAIVLERIGGGYWIYFGDTHIWAVHTTDGVRWTAAYEPVLLPCEGYYDSRLVEVAPQPAHTERGFGRVYNSANSSLVCSPGQVLFDRTDPVTLIGRTEEPFMAPTTELQRTGQVSDIVFILQLAESASTSLI